LSLCLYAVKFLPESSVASTSSKMAVTLAGTESQVRFSLRIGGEFKPAISAAMVE
jgi:hypothetical protein